MSHPLPVSAVAETEATARFGELFRAYHSVILAAAYNRLSDVGDAEDITAEVFSAAWDKRDQAAHVFSLPWLYNTLRNKVGNEYRRRERVLRREEKARNTSPTSELDAQQSAERIELRRVVSMLQESDRELIWMAFWEELTGEEMAAVLGCSHTTLRVRLSRAKKRLKILIDQSDAPEGGDLT